MGDGFLESERDALMQELIEAALDGRLTDSDRTRLQQWLLEDSERLADYIERVRLHAELGWHLFPEKTLTVDELVRNTHTELMMEDVIRSRAVENEIQLAHTLALDEPETNTLVQTIQRHSVPIIIGLLATLMAMAVLWIGDSYLGSDDFNDRLALGEARQTTADLFFAARITDQQDCVLADGKMLPELLVENWLLPDTKIEILSGKLEITFEDDVVISLSGPASFEIDAAGVGVLKNGKLTARVPEQKNSFTIRSRRLNFISAGSEHEIEVSPSGTAELHVHSGAVKYEAREEGVFAR